MDDENEDIIEDMEEFYDENEDAFEALAGAAEEIEPAKRTIVVRATPDGFTPAEMGEDPAVGGKVYTEGLATCIGLLVSGQIGTGETINVLQHFHPNSASEMQEQWTKFKDAVYGAGFSQVRAIISPSNPDQLPAEIASHKDQMAYTNDYVKQLMANLFGGYEPEEYPHDANKAHQLPHGVIKADGGTIEINGNRV